MTEAAAVCPYCRAPFEPGDDITPCPACGTAHHADCFAENGGCTIFGCTAAPTDDPKISVTPTDFTPPPQPPPSSFPGTSLYNLRAAPTAAAPPPTVAPPPRPEGAPPPPPPLSQPMAAYRPNPYASFDYVRPKRRVVFVLLAVFLGSFGAHNFYAGYNKKAVVQLMVTLCSCFYASLITWIWAIVEACTITMDDDGVPLS